MLSLAVILALTGFTARADYSTMSIGKGGTGVIDTGITALPNNPAGVHFDTGSFSLRGDFILGAGNTYLDSDDLRDAVDEDFEDIIEELGEEGISAYGNLNTGAKFRAGPIGGFSGSITGFAGGEARASGEMGSGVFRFLEDLEDVDFDNVQVGDLEEWDPMNLDDTEFGYSATVDYGASLSYDITERAGESVAEFFSGEDREMRVNRLAVGGTYKYKDGAVGEFSTEGQMEFVDKTSFFTEEIADIDENDLDEKLIVPNTPDVVKVEGKYSDSDDTASGSAVDLGVYGEFNERFSLGFSIKNVIGSLSTSSGTIIDGEMDIDAEEVAKKIEDGQDEPEDLIEDYEEIISEQLDYDEETGSISYRLPMIINLGGAYQASEDVEVSGKVAHARHDVGPNDTRLAAGVETTRLNPVDLRAGANYSSLRESVSLSAGAGFDLGPMQADLAFSDLRGIFSSAKSFDAAIEFGLEF
ncbi:DUF5723 family protein [Halarsenatibacter silvermanii]|uniref:DUF5723 domain-containing protein n=1 Tax=Halarsenatibacter silvermanii TaxID=321763 RepID=A0A1G9HPV6_9FIRM|nr:DUF5723 family protein [Halarsenatibacter silvermanii]SDL15011.1 hypothetical protein SAMN04488692_1022 [Halarsenatibacter silvermanii]